MTIRATSQDAANMTIWPTVLAQRAAPQIPDHVAGALVPFPEGKRPPFGWPVSAVGNAAVTDPLVLSWASGSRAGPTLLRLTVACDDREEKLIEVRTLHTRTLLGSLEVRFADPHQRLGLLLNTTQTELVLAEGLELTVVHGTTPLWLFAGSDIPHRHQPHLLSLEPEYPLGELYHRLTSLDSVQPFGWMEGCVLDALRDMADVFPQHRNRIEWAIKEHLRQYIHDGRLVYEDPRSRPMDNQIYGIEGTLPFAVLAATAPNDPTVSLAVDSWLARIDEEGCVCDGPSTAEGCYTVAYPMAVIARQRGDSELARLALHQLRIRQERLTRNGTLYLRSLHGGGCTYRNWARAYAWYLLGIVRTVRELDGLVDATEMRTEARRTAALVRKVQTPSGLWHCFTDEPESGPEASGSAGIAAALALGREAGVFDEAAGDSAARAWVALSRLLTADGWLSGCSQANKGGEALQRSGYRVISGVGTGLMGQLGATLMKLPSQRQVKPRRDAWALPNFR